MSDVLDEARALLAARHEGDSDARYEAHVTFAARAPSLVASLITEIERLRAQTERMAPIAQEAFAERDALRKRVDLTDRAVALLRHTTACDASRDRFPCICGVDDVLAEYVSTGEPGPK